MAQGRCRRQAKNENAIGRGIARLCCRRRISAGVGHGWLATGIFFFWIFALPAAENQQAARDSREAEAIGAAALWENFTSALRSGRFPDAHACFSPASQRAFPFAAFAAHYHPLTAAYEATLSPVEEGQFRLCGDYAVLRFVAAGASAPAADNREVEDAGSNGKRLGIMVTALMVRENGGWHLVAASRERAEKLEAQARNVLRSLAAVDAVRRAWESGTPLGDSELVNAAPSAMRCSEAVLCRQCYAFSLAAAADGLRLQAEAKTPELRSFAMSNPDSAPSAWQPTQCQPCATSPHVSSSPQHTIDNGENSERDAVDNGAEEDVPPPPPDMGDPAEAAAKGEP